jgi:FkbM family methyltransferase
LSIKDFAKQTLKKLDIGLLRYSRLQQFEEAARVNNIVQLLVQLPSEHSVPLLKDLLQSHSQIGQDLFALSMLDFKTDGFFVEFGATNGVDLSNTCLLERNFGWKGILAEPAKRWHEALKNNRKCHIETNCVWKESNSTITFNEANIGEFSTIDSFSKSDLHDQIRKNGTTYTVNTISFQDMLDKYNAPRKIDFLSIDTEGSEFDILNSLDFNKYQFNVITCEHNFAPQREHIHSLLTKNGYVRKFTELSQFDDWYVKEDNV